MTEDITNIELPQEPGGRSGRKRAKETNYSLPKNLEEYIMANNAHLQVLLEAMAKTMADITEIKGAIESWVSNELYADPKRAYTYREQMRAETKILGEVQHQALKLQVHMKYLELAIAKY